MFYSQKNLKYVKHTLFNLLKVMFQIILFWLLTTTYVFAYDDTSTWQPIGSIAFSSGYSTNTKIAIAPDGTLYVAYLSYVNGSGDDRITVMKFADNSWQVVGYPGISNGRARDLNLVIAPDGTPYVGFEDTSVGYYRASVMKFNGIIWEYVGLAGFSNVEAIGTKLALAPDSTPYVAYRDYPNKNSVIVKKFNALAWVTVGEPDISDGYVDYLSLTVASDGIPYVAYSYTLGTVYQDNKTKVKWFDGCNWESVGITNFTNKKAYSIDLKISDSGIPYIAFHTSDRNLVVTHFKNYIWTEVGSIPFNTTKPVSLFIINNLPYIAFSDFHYRDKATVINFINNQWSAVGNADFSPSDANYINLAIAQNGTPYVVYQDYYNSSKVTVMGYIGTDPARTK